jgi:hypothetical protein
MFIQSLIIIIYIFLLRPDFKRLYSPETSLHEGSNVPSQLRTSDPGRLAWNDMSKKQTVINNLP